MRKLIWSISYIHVKKLQNFILENIFLVMNHKIHNQVMIFTNTNDSKKYRIHMLQINLRRNY